MFAETDAEAKQRFESTRHVDPLPEVAPSLLNTADLLDYIAATGMIFPFKLPRELDKGLKPASCAIPFAGRVIAWQPDPEHPERTERVDEEHKPGHTLLLPRNSIVYITLQPYFRLPDYLAGRYNLTIKQIYRGLLVGTGPLVDPGFEGYLSVPVHNLTGGEYEITAGDPLVWMEFTKLTAHRSWNLNARASRNPYVAFPPRKQHRDLDDYLRAASPRPIVSSIPLEVGHARRAAEKAQRSVRRFQAVSAAAGVLLLVAIATLLLQVSAGIRDEGKDRESLEHRVDVLTSEAKDRRLELQAARRQIRRLASQRP